MIQTHNRITYSKGFWLIITSISIMCTWFAAHYFSRAFPIVDISLTMNREQALTASAERAHLLHIGPQKFQQAATFYTDNIAKLYIELDGGGTTQFRSILEEHTYEPFRWQVRHFSAGSAHELYCSFTPSGKPYGFIEKIPETVPGSALSTVQAQQIAQQDAAQDWGIDFSQFRLIESSQEIQPSNRVDHTFVYERTNIKLKDATFRLKITVSGNKISELTHYMKIPEDFLLRYQELRASNTGIATTATIFFIIFYLLGCCGIGLILLIRRRYILWKPSFIAALVIGFFGLCSNLNEIPLNWMYYDTALGMHQFLLSTVISSVISFIMNTAFMVGVIAAAEGLTRMAFGTQPQLWRSWLLAGASSHEIFGRTLGGYLLVGFDLAFIVIMYAYSLKYLGWWVPSDHLINPNVLATYFPWLAALAPSIQAGFIEECIFRALPLASAALLGNKFGNKKWWILSVFILQAIVFGAAHATYPTLPSYARLIELIIPSFIFGGIYLRFGLLPAILSHVLFDLVWFSLPIFVSDASGAWKQQSIIIIAAMIPLIITFIARLRRGAWYNLPTNYYNENWQPPIVNMHQDEAINVPSRTIYLSSFSRSWLHRTSLIVAIGGIFLVSMFYKTDDIPLTISRHEALEKAYQHIIDEKFEIGSREAFGNAVVGLQENNLLQHKFVWQHTNKETYKNLLNTYLMPAHWLVRFITFNGSTTERAEEYQVRITDSGTIRRYTHNIPESKPGAQLQEDEARALALKELMHRYNLKPEDVEEMSAKNKQYPERRDWLFVYAHPGAFNIAGGQARIHIIIGGNEVIDSYQFIFIPEDWERSERTMQQTRSIIMMLCILVLLFFTIFVLCIHKKQIVNIKIYGIFSSLIFAFLLAGTINRLPQIIANFNTAEPFLMQLFIVIITSIIPPLGMALVFGYALTITRSIFPSIISCSHTSLFCYGIGLASAYLSSISISKYLLGHSLPEWGNYQKMVVYLPELFLIITILFQYTVIACLCIGIINALNYIKHTYNSMYLIWVINVIAAIASMAVISHEDSYITIIIEGTLLAIINTFMYLYAFRFDIRIAISFAGGISLLLGLLCILTPKPSLSMIISYVLTAGIIYCITRYWMHKMHKPDKISYK